ncbi:MAG: hypothetical protein Q7V05_11665 [Methanoregula sp.]|nr:hypothetical protein [Methanoregula sp.]
MVKTNVKIVRDFHKISDRVPKGKKDPQVIPTSKPEGREYEIKEDSIHQFSIGQIITESEYNSVKDDYDIRMKDWDGHSEHLAGAKKVFYISGRKRELIKDFLVKRKYNVKELEHLYHVTGKIAWMAMSDEIQEMKNVKFIYIHVVGESGYDLAARTLKLA